MSQLPSLNRLLAYSVACSMTFFSLGCQGGDGDGGGSGSPNKRGVDTRNFKNTANKSELIAKGKNVEGFFDLSSTRGQFAEASNGESLMLSSMPQDLDCEEPTVQSYTNQGVLTEISQQLCSFDEDGFTQYCSISTESEDGVEVSRTSTCEQSDPRDPISSEKRAGRGTTAQEGSGEAMAQGFLPYFPSQESCEDTFNSFEDTYLTVKTQYKKIFETLTDPQSMQLTGTGESGQLVEIQDPDHAIAYEFNESEQTEGYKLSGKISGGANDDLMVLKQVVAYEIDTDMMNPSVESQGQFGAAQSMKMSLKTDEEIAIDLEKKIVDMRIDTTFTSLTGDISNDFKVKGSMAVSAGDQKWIRSNMALTMPRGEDSQDFSFDITAQIVGNELKYGGTVNTNFGGKRERGAFGFTLVNTGEGACEVKEFISELPGGIENGSKSGTETQVSGQAEETPNTLPAEIEFPESPGE